MVDHASHRPSAGHRLSVQYRHVRTDVTNGAIVIHTQRLKSDPGGNLLS
ncbi:chemotaxis protein [Escherichia coli]|nr:chemotaxis protein [Escherichia coli]EEY9252173.1 chemotaxis protein [Escherichia coli]EEY9281701.1 chemotaxis protein [Escherichia coli]EEY9366049.1 chemotaxis protein [Escherichia coli]EEY9411629.1 chemotaxis protein [Escherichia coli]